MMVRERRHERPSVIAVVADEEWQAHVRSALDSWAALTVLPNVRLLPDRTPDIVLWHLGSAEDADDGCIRALKRFRMQAVRTSVVGYCRISALVAPLLVVAGRVGVDRVLLRGHDDLRLALRRELEDRGLEAVSREVLARLALPDGEARQIVAHCARRAGTTVLTVEQLAEECGVSRRTLHHRLHNAGLPSPEQIIGWTRLLLAAALLEESQASVASIANRLGFSSETALRGMLLRYAQCTPRELRGGGGSAQLIAAFRQAIISQQRGAGIPLSTVDVSLSV